MKFWYCPKCHKKIPYYPGVALMVCNKSCQETMEVRDEDNRE